MRPFHVVLLCLAVAGCQCAPDVATPVVLRIRNASSEALFVDATDGRMGLAVQRRMGTAWFDFVETPPCACLTCDRICDNACDCPRADPPRRVLKIPAGGTFEREWIGEVLVDSAGACRETPVGGPACLGTVIPSPGETFRVRFCYANVVPSAGPTDGSAPVPGVLPPAGTRCLEREFTPADGVVELGPLPAETCSLDAECPVPGTVCLQGTCTGTCPAHTFPAVGGAWQVYIPEPEELGVPGFFSVSYESGRRIQSGTGTLSSVRYSNGSMTLQLSRPAGPSGAHKATLTATLPPEAAVPLAVGEWLTVQVVDATNASNSTNRALVVRDAEGGLLLAADPAQAVAVLGAEDTRPLAVASLPATEGCEATPCGKRIFFKTEFRAGSTVATLAPGESADLVAGGSTLRALSVSNAEQRGESCPVGRRMPYVLTNLRGAP
ncbi:hypothetical protein P2318_20710 [Myxococcaceae bacterium GXIMD 01537]